MFRSDADFGERRGGRGGFRGERRGGDRGGGGGAGGPGGGRGAPRKREFDRQSGSDKRYSCLSFLKLLILYAKES